MIKITDCTTVDMLSTLLGTSYKQLSSLIYPDTNNSYFKFFIPKKSGEEREINAPNRELKSIQKNLNAELIKLYPPRYCAHGFIADKSIITNARPHTRKKFVFNVDLENFFHSIHFGRVRNLFMSPHFAFNHKVATVLAQICCHKGFLPQGAPTSPLITNFICFKLDGELCRLAADNKCSVTRYVDDISFSFSCHKDKLPKEIVLFEEDNTITIGHSFNQIINKNGFKININKVRLQSKFQRQQVTGLIVNDKTNVPRSFIRKTRSMLYCWGKFGLEKAEREFLTKFLEKKHSYHRFKLSQPKNQPGSYFKKTIKGRINFIGMVRGIEDIIYRRLLYKYSELIGKPDKTLIKSNEDKLEDSTFIIECNASINQGTAFLLEQVGLITALHVVKDIGEDNSCMVEFFKHDEHDREIKRKTILIKKCKISDIAIFKKSKDFDDIEPLKIGDSSKLKYKTKIKILGFPGYGKGDGCYYREGTVTQLKKIHESELWLTDIPIIHGSSGGPVLNDQNEVVGVALIGSKNDDDSTIAHGFIPISEVIKLHEKIN